MMNSRVCFIYKTTYPGVLTELNQIPIYLAKKGISVDLIVIDGGIRGQIDALLPPNMEIHRISLNDERGYTFYFLFKAREIINKRNFDLVHVFHFRWVFLLPLLCKRKDLKWLLDIRSGNLKNDIRRPLANFITRVESMFFDEVAVIHEDLAKEIFGNEFGESHKLPVFPIGVDLSSFKKDLRDKKSCALEVGPDNYVVCYIGHLYRQRNLHNLIRAISIARETFPYLRLLFVGDGQDKNRLKDFARGLNLSQNVIFTGFIPYENIPEYLGLSDIAISYVPMTKGFDAQPPFKTIEYLASEAPVIATNTRGNRHFVKDGENGLLVNDDPLSISRAIIRILKSPELKEKISRNARKSVEEYDWEKIIEEKILPVYKVLLKK